MRQLNGTTRRRSRLGLAVGIVVCAVAATALAGVAIARLTTYRTNLSFDRTFKVSATKAKFSGTVKSPKATCKDNREVQIYDLTAGDVRLGRTFSTPSGYWATQRKAPANGHQLYALVEAKYFANGKKRCNVDRTGNRAFPFP